ncbi:MAG: PilN domain-containing protein, partial [Gemmatimonadota bacterium]
VLSRDARRYFASPWEAPVVGDCRLEKKRDGPGPVLAAAAPTGLVEALFQAGTAVGWEIKTVVPAQSAWAAMANGLRPEHGDDGSAPSRDRDSLAVVALVEETIEVLQTREEELIATRRLPAEWDAERLARFVAETLREEGPLLEARGAPTGVEEEVQAPSVPTVVVIGPEPMRGRFAEALTAHDVDALITADDGFLANPTRLAAAFASRVKAPRLVPVEIRAAIRRRSRRQALALAGGGALLLALAGVVEIWGLHREVNAVAARRASLAAEVRAALGAGDSLVSGIEKLITLGELERETSRLSLALPEVTEHLPRTSYLESFTARADTLLLTGAAERAAVVFEGLQKSQGIEAVQSEGPIRRDEAEEGVMRESFTLSARIGERAP